MHVTLHLLPWCPGAALIEIDRIEWQQQYEQHGCIRHGSVLLHNYDGTTSCIACFRRQSTARSPFQRIERQQRLLFDGYLRRFVDVEVAPMDIMDLILCFFQIDVCSELESVDRDSFSNDDGYDVADALLKRSEHFVSFLIMEVLLEHTPSAGHFHYAMATIYGDSSLIVRRQGVVRAVIGANINRRRHKFVDDELACIAITVFCIICAAWRGTTVVSTPVQDSGSEDFESRQQLCSTRFVSEDCPGVISTFLLHIKLQNTNQISANKNCEVKSLFMFEWLSSCLNNYWMYCID